jgi:hypothetical protein
MRSAMVALLISVPLVVGAAEGPRVPATAPKEALPFIEDDYPRALAEARARKLPLFVDSWAPW